MKSLKRMSLYFIALVLHFNVASAQTSTASFSEEQKAEMQKNMEEFVETLQLTKAQQPEFKTISRKYGKQLLALKESDASKMSKYRKMKSINKSRNKEMKSLLSKDQYKRYIKKQEKMQKEMKARNRG